MHTQALLLATPQSTSGGGGDITSNLGGWWKFDDNTGTTAADSSGNANTGSLLGTSIPTWVAPGKIGVAMLNFGGTGYVGCGAGATLDGTAYTLAAWIRASSFANSYNLVIGCAGAKYRQLFVKSNGKLAAYFNPSGGNTFYDGTGANTLSTSTWYHLAMTYSASTGLIGYVNAGVDGTAAANGAMQTGGGGDTTISIDLGTPNRFCNGDLDDVRLYTRALTATDITTLYNYT